MHVLTSVLLWLTAVATSVQADDVSFNDISLNLNLHDFKDHFSLFDVTTSASIADVKAALGNVVIDQSFKVIGEDRFIIVFRSNDTAALHSLTFPHGSEVTQYPVEAIDNYLDMYGTGSGWKGYYDQPIEMDTIWLFLDWELKMPETKCESTFEIELIAWTQNLREPYNQVKPLIYPIVGNYPHWLIFAKDIHENSLMNLIKGDSAFKGGPGNNKMTVKRIVPV